MKAQKDILSRFQNKKALIIGDVMIDRYLSGDVQRISPEAPVPIVQLNSIDNRLGGAGNVALNIKALGGIPLLLTIVGDDENGVKFKSLLNDNSIIDAYTTVSTTRRTTVKTRIVSQNQQMLRVDAEDTHELSAQEANQVLAVYYEILKSDKPDVIILQDYNKGLFNISIIHAIVEAAKGANIPVTVDPKKKNFLDFIDVTIFKPNLKEVREALNHDFNTSLESLKEASNKIKSILHNEITIITLSEKGLFIDDGEIAEIYPTIQRNVSDVCGAGDTVISTLSLGIASDFDRATLAILANIAGGQVCERPGVVPVNLKQLTEEWLGTAEIEKKM